MLPRAKQSRLMYHELGISWGQKGDGVFWLCPVKLPNQPRSVTSPASVPDRHSHTSPNLPPTRCSSPEIASNAYMTPPPILSLDLSTCSVCLSLPCPVYQNFAGFPIHHGLLSLWRPLSHASDCFGTSVIACHVALFGCSAFIACHFQT